MIYKFQTLRSIWKSKAYKSYMWAFFKNDCLLFKSSLLLSLWIVRQENQSSILLYFLSLFFFLHSSPRVFFFVTKKWSPRVLFFSLFLFALLLLFFIFIFFEIKVVQRNYHSLTHSPYLLFFKLIFKMNLPTLDLSHFLTVTIYYLLLILFLWSRERG